ncbi:MAG: GNAT family N-acetyltransferase [Chloroflexota bacterium]|nr:GNAT family N-acetyltransferase [Chloroflexota bacterium]
MSDMEPLAQWADALNTELRSEDPPPGEQSVRRRIGLGRMYVWDNGGPVSMAACDGPTPRGIRINFVYTPPEHRARGYASACVADLSQLLLDEGRRFCALFTDLANPVSNRLYARLGYRPICDFDEYIFVP